MGIDLLFSDPFYEGIELTPDTPFFLPVAIGSHGYVIDLREYRRRTIPALRQPSDNSSEVSDASLNSQGLWRRAQSDWSYGAGQKYFDNEDSDRRRFNTSKGVDPWTEGELRLHFDTASIRSSSNSNLDLMKAGDYLYVIDGTGVVFSNNPDAGTFTTMTGLGGTTVKGLATDGTSVFVADGTNIKKVAIGTAAAGAFSAYVADTVSYANGRLLASSGAQLVEVDAAGATTVISTHINASFKWLGAVGALTGIYAWGKAGDVGEVYFIGIDTTTGNLAAPVIATPLPAGSGETVESMIFDAKVVVLGTSKGLRVAAFSGNGLEYGAVITAPGNVGALAVEGNSVWFAWSNFDGASTGVGRARLDRFTSTLVPAYASDLMATAQGQVNGIVRLADKTYFAVASSGVYGQDTDRVTSGTMRVGRVRFGTIENKMITSMDLRHEPLDGTVTVSLIKEDGTEVSIGVSSVVGSLSPPTPMSVDVNGVESVEPKMLLTRSTLDTTDDPRLRRWIMRALATPVRVDEIIAPFIIRTKVDTLQGEGHTQDYEPLEEFLYLKSLESGGQPVRYIEGRASYSVYVDGIEVRPGRWADDRSFFEGTVVVRMITLEPSS